MFPLGPEEEVSLSFPAEMSVESAETMAAFVKLALDQALQRAKRRETLGSLPNVETDDDEPR